MAHVSSLYFNPTTDECDWLSGEAEGIADSGVIKVTALFALELIPANRKVFFLQAKNMKRGKVFMGRSVKKKKKKNGEEISPLVIDGEMMSISEFSKIYSDTAGANQTYFWLRWHWRQICPLDSCSYFLQTHGTHNLPTNCHILASHFWSPWCEKALCLYLQT